MDTGDSDESRTAGGLPVAVIAALVVLVGGLGAAVAIRVHDRHQAERDHRQELAHRSELLRELQTEITAYARRQVQAHELSGPILHTRCQVFQGDDPSDLAARRARFSCTAVTLETSATYMGHLFVGKIDYPTGRIRFHPKGIPIWLGI